MAVTNSIRNEARQSVTSGLTNSKVLIRRDPIGSRWRRNEILELIGRNIIPITMNNKYPRSIPRFTRTFLDIG